MKTRTIMVLMLLLSISSVFAQADWLWVETGGGSSPEQAYDIAVDNEGNTFIAGDFRGISTFGSTTLSAAGWSDIFVAKTDAAGNWLWAVSVGAGSWDRGKGICLDSNGDAYVTGYLKNTVYFGDIEVVGTGDDYAYGITVDTYGNSYIAGSFRGTATFGSTNITAVLNSDIFVAKMDINGNWLWAVGVGAGSWDRGKGICLDSSGNAYVTGYFKNTVYFGDIEVVGTGVYNAFVAKINTSGDWQWAINISGTGSSKAIDISLDTNGNLFITGCFDESITCGSYNITSNGSDDIFIAKTDNSGNWLGAIGSGGSSWDNSYGLVLDSSGNPCITGVFDENCTFGTTTLNCYGDADIFIAKANSSLTTWQWAKGAGGSNDDIGINIIMDEDDNIHITGYFESTATFGLTNLISSGYTDIFVSKLNSNGDWLWSVKAGGNSYDKGYGIDIDASGNSYISGLFRNTCNFGTNDVTSNGADDIFISKLNSSGNWQWAISAGGNTGITSTSWSETVPGTKLFYRVTASE